uniref:Protein ARV n=1 Tax=Crassostrea virginica TaxID=6565 RepID=A0A8B8DN49_CRAVI|nr:protein ARV1-like isoform X1 [Crassostrea virginica]XP_022332850.1 protein ARV1-like isoform X1 [Crassostrea virginica]
MTDRPKQLQFRCINCGRGASDLFKDYNNGIIKMKHCIQCSAVIDKYIEYDPVVISLDILLLNRKALRHVLFNSNIKGYWKYIILLLMFDAFVKLTLQRAKGEITPVNPTYIIYSATEWDFYKNCLLASVELSSVVFVISLLVLVFSQIHVPAISSKEDPSLLNWKDIVRALILSNFGKTLVILVVLCGTQNSDTFIQLIKAYICAANVQALRVCLPSWNSAIVIALTVTGHLSSACVTRYIQIYLFGS